MLLVTAGHWLPCCWLRNATSQHDVHMYAATHSTSHPFDAYSYVVWHVQASNRGHRVVVLSVLCDLLENPRAHPFFHEWRSSRNQQTAAHLLLKLWGEEDALRGITADGLLTNTQHPLAGTGKAAQWVPAETITYGGLLELSGTNGSAQKGGGAGGMAGDGRGSAVDAMLAASSGEPVLAKLYGCFRLLGFSNFGYMEAADAAQLTLVEKWVLVACACVLAAALSVVLDMPVRSSTGAWLRADTVSQYGRGSTADSS